MRLRAATLLSLIALGAPARADVFSPGPLASPHASLEGLKNCTACHPAGEQLSPDRCFDCHKELKARVGSGKGFHGRIPEAERACEGCHHEHQGRDAALVEWKPSKSGFEHAKTGWPLLGKHVGVGCEKCHTPRLVADPQARALVAKAPGTLLGLPTRCNACHFDEHRGQLGTDCERCHSEKQFKPPALFDHAKTAFPLEGKHAPVACEKCHAREEDKATAHDAFPAPRQPTFAHFRGIAHAACTDCHKDPHQGRFGQSCVHCHSPATAWKEVRNLEKERGFHDKTRFPLRGAHAAVDCRSCHGAPARYKGIPFAQCADCHADAHVGQIAGPAPGKPPECMRCHDLTSFKPPKFELEDHARTRYGLDGAHRAVGCALCHKQDPHLAERVPASTRAAFRKQRRPERFSFARFEMASSRCEDCHADPHAGQFGGQKPCSACHQTQSFHQVRFDHAKDSRYPLTGKHAPLACAKCHRHEKIGAAQAVRFKPLPTACQACHADPHAAQFAVKGATDCARCHETSGFKPAKFEHRPPATDFLLEGRHATLACEKCHPEVQVAPGEKARRYHPLPRTCEGCHADYHDGAFKGREFLSARGAETHAPGEATRCAACHSVEGFAGAAIAHDKTGFPLRGAHQGAACRACHVQGFDTALPTRCALCHKDVHAGELGQRCEGCHEETNWRSRFAAEAHRRTGFPLTGRHAFVPCEECHQDLRERGFARATTSCLACHQKDFTQTALSAFDHLAQGTGTECRGCHDPTRWSPARYVAHEACFEISAGPHAALRCLDCHTRLTGVQAGGACFTGTAACTRCHTHTCAATDGRHGQVPGYQCKDRKCYECHRFSTGGLH